VAKVGCLALTEKRSPTEAKLPASLTTQACERKPRDAWLRFISFAFVYGSTGLHSAVRISRDRTEE
jgi:hypothetical protein